MPKEWFFEAEIRTFKGRVLRKYGTVSDPARHFGEYMRRFYPTAKTITWWPIDAPTADGKPLVDGQKRSVEFDVDGKVVSRTPDDDVAHAGGLAPEDVPDDIDWQKSGDSRKGKDPKVERNLGQHPRHGDLNDSEHEETLAELVELQKQVQEKVGPRPGVSTPVTSPPQANANVPPGQPPK